MVSQPRRRLDPHVRQDQILDAAAALVEGEGLAAFSMEAVARRAGASKALIYAYFPNRTAVLGALLSRELARFQKAGREVVAASDTFEEMIARTTRLYLEHVAMRGALIQRLLMEPAVAEANSMEDARAHGATVSYLARAVSKKYGVSLKFARTCTELLMAVTGRAAEMAGRGAGSVAYMEALVLEIVFASLAHLARREGAILDVERAARARLKASKR